MNREAFEAACELLPDGVTWGEPITPSIVQSIVQAALSQANVNEQSQAQQPSEFLSCHHFMQMHEYTDSQGDTWTENSLASSAQDFLSSASKAYDKYLQSQAQQGSRDWKEDYADGENMYQCTCSICESKFYGYKRRVVCKVCDASQAQQPPRMQFLDRSKEKIITLLWQGICDGTVEAFDVNGMMVIPSEQGMTYVRKEDAISFFGLVEPSQAHQDSDLHWCGTCEQNVERGCGDSACQYRYKLPPAPEGEPK